MLTQPTDRQSQIKYTSNAAVIYVTSNEQYFRFQYRLASPETTRLKTSSIVWNTSVLESFSAVLYCQQCCHAFAAAAGANARYDRP